MPDEIIETREGTYTMPKDGWVCYHCGERFTSPGAAKDHFGNDPGYLAGCQIKAGEERGLLMQMRKAEDDRDMWMGRALSSESQIEMLEGQISSLSANMKSYRPFRECQSIRDVFNVYDSMEGRSLAAEERLKTSDVAIL